MNKKAIERQKKKFDAHRQYQHVFFKAKDMDFTFQWLMGTAAHGGVAIGEAYYAASRMREGDPESWERETGALAERVRARAEEAARGGHAISSGEAFLRAAMYYRATLASLRPTDPRFKPTVARMRECFRSGGARLSPPLESFDVVFEGKVLPGYFQGSREWTGPRPTLLMIGGAETFAEDLYFFIAPAAVKRGWNFATVDLPGQGETPFDGLRFRADPEIPMSVILDSLLKRQDVDGERLAAYGISAGGYFVPRAATHDKRIRACIANSLLYKFNELWNETGIPKLKSRAFRKIADRRAPFAMRMTELGAWRWGLSADRMHEMIDAIRDYRFDPSGLECPTLILVGEGEYMNPWSAEQQVQGLAAVRNPRKRLIVGPFDEGAASHCMGENLSLMSSLVFDWLEEVLAPE